MSGLLGVSQPQEVDSENYSLPAGFTHVFICSVYEKHKHI